jgi:hypothetical protein
MRVLVRAVLVVSCLLIIPVVAYAQASLTGTVKDSSGAVLPGVTVEAASDVLIEKVRTTQTDGSGRYQLLDLRPGAYVVTFTLTGFSSHRRDGIELSGSGTVSVNADLRVGAVAETVTVTGETPIVDVRSVTRQQVLTADTIDALPSSRNFVTLARMIPGTSGGGNDVGGSVLQDVGTALTVRGSNNTDTRITLNGISVMTLQAGGSLGGQQPDVGSAQEITVDTSSLSADLPTGGPRINFIPRDGGNRFSDSGFFNFANSSLQGTNYSDALKAAGLATPGRIQRNWDLSESFGGPFRKDRLWFWVSTHFNDVANEVPVLENKNAFDPTKWNYEPLEGHPGVNRGNVQQTSLRVTWQATPRNKIAGTYKVDRWCACPNAINATTSPEAANDRRFPRLRQEHLEWTSTVSNRLMFEAVGMHLFERWGNMDLRSVDDGGSLDSTQAAAVSKMISVVEQGTGALGTTPAGMTYRLRNTFNNTLVPNYAYRLALSYITGSHAVKVGYNRTHGFLQQMTYNFQPFQYRFLNGVPNQITVYATPYTSISNEDNDMGLYVQDRWTMNRITVSGALRYDYFGTSFPAQTIGPGLLQPNRNLQFPEQDNLGWKDITYRSGFVYDLLGTGKTAVRVSFNKYLLGQTLNGLGSSPSPANAFVNQANRTWNDRAGLGINNDYIPQCDFFNPLANGECGPTSPNTFGTAGGVLDTFDPDLLRGWGNRQMNYEFMAGVQHEILPRVSLDLGYFRRIWGNFQVTDNVLRTAADYTQFSMVVPTDPRLPNSGQTITGLYDVIPAKFSDTRNYNTLSDKFGNQIEHWNGMEVAVNARLHNGLTLQAAVGSAKQVEDNCEIVAQLPEMLSLAAAGGLPASVRPAQFCHRESPFLTQIKGFGVYTVPKILVQTAVTLRSSPGAAYNASLVATNAYLAANSTLGRQLAAGANGNMPVALVAPNTTYLDRRNELDLRVGKVLKAGRSRSIVSLDIYNALNTDKPITVNQSYASWLAPTEILNPRVAKISVQFDF